LIKNYAVTGTGGSRTLTADVEWTYPPAFMEIVMGDGKKVIKQRISLRDLTAFGSKHIAQTINTAGMVWVRMSIWDVATNGAFVQPVWLTPSTARTSAGGSWLSGHAFHDQPESQPDLEDEGRKPDHPRR
jgi:hypothetical protein